MMPGKDGIEWYLCGKCWEEGRQPFHCGLFRKPVQISDPHLYDALVAASAHTAGLNDVTPKADKPKRNTKRRSPS